MYGIPLAKMENKREPIKAENGLKKQLLLAIDDGLSQVLSESGTKTIYCFLEQKYHMKPEDIPNNIERLRVTLKEVFGTGALIIEKTIMENLYSQFNRTNKKIRLKNKNKGDDKTGHGQLDRLPADGHGVGIGNTGRRVGGDRHRGRNRGHRREKNDEQMRLKHGDAQFLQAGSDQ